MVEEEGAKRQEARKNKQKTGRRNAEMEGRGGANGSRK